MPLVECVPNFSEGRRPEVIAAIADAIRSAPEVHLLDVSGDPDHNRMVATFAGEPDAVVEAAFRGIREAAARIDLDMHQGVHPRIGAADVVPFVPLRGISLAECAALAHRLGQRVGDELGIPVYFYEAAALRPERTNLADLRRGGYETLRTLIASDPAHAPDVGPASMGKAGAVVIGARAPLIAFNAYLDTDDVNIAQSIAMSIRTSGGGLPFLKALGLLVNGRAQVSMNITDFRQTSLYTIMERLRAEAQQRGVSITHTELIGLMPQAALVDVAFAYLQLPANAREQMLEQRIGAVTGDFREIVFE